MQNGIDHSPTARVYEFIVARAEARNAQGGYVGAKTEDIAAALGLKQADVVEALYDLKEERKVDFHTTGRPRSGTKRVTPSRLRILPTPEPQYLDTTPAEVNARDAEIGAAFMAGDPLVDLRNYPVLTSMLLRRALSGPDDSPVNSEVVAFIGELDRMGVVRV